MALVNFGKVLSTKRPRSFLNISTILSRSLASSSSDDVNVEFLDGDRTGMKEYPYESVESFPGH